MYGNEIMLAHINNNPQEAIFGRGIDKHAHILDPTATLTQDVFKAIMQHKEVCAVVLETPNIELSDQIAQIYEVMKLKEYADDLLEGDKRSKEWFKEKDKEQSKDLQKQGEEYIPAIPMGYKFEDEDIVELAEQLQRTTFKAENERPANQGKKKLNEIHKENVF